MKTKNIPFEVGEFEGQKVIVIDGEIFDWGIDDDALNQANQYVSNKETMSAIHSDIKNYFLECLSEVLGFEPSIKQINDALELGYINDNNQRERQ